MRAPFDSPRTWGLVAGGLVLVLGALLLGLGLIRDTEQFVVMGSGVVMMAAGATTVYVRNLETASD